MERMWKVRRKRREVNEKRKERRVGEGGKTDK